MVLSITAADGASWKFAVICDTRGFASDPHDPREPFVNAQNPGVRMRVLSAIATDLVAQTCEVAIIAGDLIMGGSSDLTLQYTNWLHAMRPVYDAGIPVYPLRGNHETYGDTDGTQWLTFFGNALPQNGPQDPDDPTHTEKGFTYSATHRNALFIAEDGYLTWKSRHHPDLTWLSEQLGSNSLPHIFVFEHTPAFTVTTRTNDILAASSVRDEFWNILKSGGVRIFFGGHDHLYTCNKINGFGEPKLYQIINGVGGAPAVTYNYANVDQEHVEESISNHNANRGYNIVEIDGYKVTVRFREWHNDAEYFEDGTNNTFSYDLSPEPPTGEPVVATIATRTANDYNNDGKAEPAIYQRSARSWSVYFPTSDIPSISRTLTGTGTKPVPGDYDGDRKTDMAVYDEATGYWYMLLSGSDYSAASIQLGKTGYSAVPADYDGDGKTDVAVYHETLGLWYVLLSGSGYTLSYLKLGETGYTPVPTDYDGDGKADMAVYHQASGYWYVLLSGSGYALSYLKLGETGYTPVPSDYDGDGKADPAVFHQASGYWYILLSGSGYALTYAKFGETGYTPVPADYDGDGKTDLTVYQDGTALWFSLRSSDMVITGWSFGGP